MPVIFSSSLLALPSSLARLTASESIAKAAILFFPGQPLYVPSSVILICFFNYFYTFLQLNPDDMSEELKKGGASVPGIRPGKKTSDFISGTLNRMSVLGSVFLGGLALTPPLIEVRRKRRGGNVVLARLVDCLVGRLLSCSIARLLDCLVARLLDCSIA